MFLTRIGKGPAVSLSSYKYYGIMIYMNKLQVNYFAGCINKTPGVITTIILVLSGRSFITYPEQLLEILQLLQSNTNFHGILLPSLASTFSPVES